jgi:hypothetical protein
MSRDARRRLAGGALLLAGNAWSSAIPLSAANRALKRAVVRLTCVGSHTCTHDITKGHSNDVDEAEGEISMLMLHTTSPTAQEFYMIPMPGGIRLTNGHDVAGLHVFPKFNFVSEEPPLPWNIAHEIFHTWQPNNETNPASIKNLMYSPTTDANLRKDQWDLAHH